MGIAAQLCWRRMATPVWKPTQTRIRLGWVFSVARIEGLLDGDGALLLPWALTGCAVSAGIFARLYLLKVPKGDRNLSAISYILLRSPDRVS